MATLKKLTRPMEWHTESQTMVACDYVIAVVDLYDDGSHQEVVCLHFESHAGLQAEWEAGSSTAVLEAALEGLLGGVEGDELTESQRGAIGQQFAMSEG